VITLRDGAAFVGQAILAGLVAGLLNVSVDAGANVMQRRWGLWDYHYDPNWSQAANPLYWVGVSVAFGALLVSVLVLARMVLRRDTPAWIVSSLFTLLFTNRDLSRGRPG